MAGSDLESLLSIRCCHRCDQMAALWTLTFGGPSVDIAIIPLLQFVVLDMLFICSYLSFYICILHIIYLHSFLIFCVLLY